MPQNYVGAVNNCRNADIELKKALHHLKQAFDYADQANAYRLGFKIEEAIGNVRSARKSAGGAVRHAQHKELRTSSV